jgi:hypothetical protein
LLAVVLAVAARAADALSFRAWGIGLLGALLATGWPLGLLV